MNEINNQEMNSHAISQYFKVNGRMKGHISKEGYKRSYFLRAKTAPHFSNNETRSSISEHIDAYSGTASSEEEDLANCLVMLSNKSQALSSDDDHKGEELLQSVGEKGMFQCKACKKIFSSHQALGGHRASHKKVKGCFAAKLDGVDLSREEYEPVTSSGRPMSKRPKMHECSVCRRVFTSGQALGGHKRCHWLTTSSSSADNAFVTSFRYDNDYQYQQLVCKKPITNTNTINPLDIIDDEQDHRPLLDLNLNLTPVAPNQQQINDNGEKGCEEVNKKIRKLSHDHLGDVDYDAGWLQMGIG